MNQGDQVNEHTFHVHVYMFAPNIPSLGVALGARHDAHGEPLADTNLLSWRSE